MMRLGLLLSFLVCVSSIAAESPTTATGEAADLVRQWWKEGAAAGNIGDHYDNRDRGHRNLNLALFPQLELIKYTTNEIASNQDYAVARFVRTNLVVIGNSSTAAGLYEGGSNPRSMYVRPAMVAVLYEQYIHNNLYAYPEHQDHDPGHNGTPGYGDLFPLNSPYVYISQGSSGSELPFLEAAALTMAAFRPEVKSRLIQSRLLMPTVQMLLRRSYQGIESSADYLTGEAHPTVFDSSRVNALAMVRGAHLVEPGNIPPMVQLQVIDDTVPRPEVDYADLVKTEKLSDSPCAIARVFRGYQRTRRIVVTAENSFDVNRRPLTWHWAVLRGDTNRISIKPLNENGSRVEITAAYHERRPIEPGAELESNRIDVGCFVHNGIFYSAPGFVSYFFSDAEARAYDSDGKILDIGHGAGTSAVEIIDWGKFFEICRENGPQAQFLKAGMPPAQWSAIIEAAETHKEKIPDAELKKAAEPVQKILDLVISKWIHTADFTIREHDALEKLYKAADRRSRDEFERGKELLAYYGLLKKASGLDFALTPLRKESGTLQGRLTPFEKNLMERLNAAVVSLLVFEGSAKSTFTVNYVDRMLAAQKNWRDVFHYGATGNLTGWTRYTPGMEPVEFNADGMALVNGKTRTVNYEIKTDRYTHAHSIHWSIGGKSS